MIEPAAAPALRIKAKSAYEGSISRKCPYSPVRATSEHNPPSIKKSAVNTSFFKTTKDNKYKKPSMPAAIANCPARVEKDLPFIFFSFERVKSASIRNNHQYNPHHSDKVSLLSSQGFTPYGQSSQHMIMNFFLLHLLEMIYEFLILNNVFIE